jgi:L-threonylcarbamoyladenylate synthase
MNKIIEILNSGGVVMHPTETCYGLAVDIFNPEALQKLYSVKQMAGDKPVSILVDSLEMAQKYGEFSPKALELAQKYWPGPLSIVVPRTEGLPLFLNPKEEFVSIRWSSLPFCVEMVGALGRPVTTTSANISGEPEFYLPKEVMGVDLLVDGGEIIGSKPSTIVKVVGDSFEILRQGSLVLEMV